MKKIYEPNTKFNKIFMFIGNTITVITGVAAILSGIVRAFTKNISNLPSFVINILSYGFHFCIVACTLALLCLFIRIIYEGIKSKSQAFDIQRKLTEFLHQQLIHKVRNNIVELEILSEKLQRFSKDNNSDAISECYNNELQTLKSNLKEYIDQLSEYLTEYRGSIISVCIKIFKKRDRNRNEFQSEEIISLVRSSNTESIRNNDNKTFVGQNTDFTNLCKGQIVFFGCSNLLKIKESGQYINDSVNWNDNRYISTLVTPIRYYNNNFTYNSNNNSNTNIKSDVIGFLCIDSEEEINEWEYADSFELQLLAVFSDILYVYIKEFYSCFENVGCNLN